MRGMVYTICTTNMSSNKIKSAAIFGTVLTVVFTLLFLGSSWNEHKELRGLMWYLPWNSQGEIVLQKLNLYFGIFMMICLFFDSIVVLLWLKTVYKKIEKKGV